MPRKRRTPKTRRAEVTPAVLALLSDGEGNHPVRFFITDIELRAAWDEVKDQILEENARDYPGTRPLHWWRFNAPEARRRLGGTGKPDHGGDLKRGLPWFWTPDPQGVPIDPSDPPAFESEAAYLQRLDLLLPGEFDRLIAADFEPETIGAEAESDEAA